MSKPTILVTGATGNTGGALVRLLLEQGFPVRAVVRGQDARARGLESLGAQTVVADLFDPDQVHDALKGVQRAYFVPVYHPHMIQSAVAFTDAAREARLESVVHLSQWLSHRHHPSAMTRQVWLADRLFAGLDGVAVTVLNPGFFADNFLRVIDVATLMGVFPVLSGLGRAAPVSNEDIARVAAAVLADPAPHAGQTYRPTGPELLDGRGMAAAVARAIGRQVRPVDLPFWLFVKIARSQGIDPMILSGYRHYLADMVGGGFSVGGGVTDVVERIGGAKAETFETIARRYAAQPFAKVTPLRRLAAMASFLVAPLKPGYDLDRWDRQMQFPAPAAPSLSVDDARWRAEHGVDGGANGGANGGAGNAMAAPGAQSIALRRVMA
jgi:uncharacterized protein YbjT (DUF2867 family)